MIKKTALFLLIAFSAGCFNSKPPEEIAVTEKTNTRSEKLNKTVIESWGRQKDFFIEENFEIIEWDKAKEILQKDNLRGGKLYHTGWLTIYTINDRNYLVKPPNMDALWDLKEKRKLKLKGFAAE